jgi:hypothetical protein
MLQPLQDSHQRASLGQLVVMGTAVAFVTALYYGLPCYRYTADGLIAAIRMRDSGGLYVHPNHPLFPLLPGLVHAILRFLGSDLNEVEMLFLWSTFSGVLSAVMLMVILRMFRLSIGGVLVGLGLFAFSNAVWFFSVTPNPSSTALVTQIQIGRAHV